MLRAQLGDEVRKYEDQTPLGWSREEPRRAAVVAGRTEHGRRKRRDGGSVGKQKLLKQRVYHELSKSLWAPDVGRSSVAGWLKTFKRRSDCRVIYARADSRADDAGGIGRGEGQDYSGL